VQVSLGLPQIQAAVSVFVALASTIKAPAVSARSYKTGKRKTRSSLDFRRRQLHSHPNDQPSSKIQVERKKRFNYLL
jgi:hypothetical protein